MMPGYRPHDLWRSGEPIRGELAAYQQTRAEARKALAETGVTPVALEEYDAATARQVAALQASLTEAETDDRRRFNLAIGYPVVMVTLGLALLTTPRRPGFARNLPFMSAGAISAAALAFLIGWGLLAVGWVETGGISRWWWLVGLAIGCAITAVPLPREGDLAGRQELWRYGFEPLLYALVASQVDLLGPLSILLVIVVLILFGDGKALGATLLRRYVSRRPWRESLRLGTAVAAGSPLALATAYGLYALDIIDSALFTALVIANIVCILLVPLALRLIGDSQPA
jgi:hypothetical protein